MASLTIGEVAARAGVNTSHIRYYEREGVLPEPARTGGQRRYDEAVLHRLAIIDVAQRAGLTLAEIRELTGPDNRTVHA
jgi:MerR family redox-sensitive transcriptional activator SoxR